jgi:hypothetical protein
LPLLAVLRREFPEAREVDLAATLQRVGDRIENGVDRFRSLAPRQIRPLGNAINELLLRHYRSSLPGCSGVEIRLKTLTGMLIPLNHAALLHF